MSKINIHCPACNILLEIEEEYFGRELLCSECQETFVAKPADQEGASLAEKKTSSTSRKKPAGRRWDDKDEAEDVSPQRSGDNTGGGPSGAAIVGLVLGITSIPVALCCSILNLPLSITAVVLGAISWKNQGSTVTAIAAMCTGAIGLILSIGIFILVFFIQGINTWPAR